jgi:hypothetical protein
MKLLRACIVVSVALAACSSPPKPAVNPTAITSAPVEPAATTTTAASKPASAPQEDPHAILDPLALSGSLSLPKIERTPKNQLRANSRGDLDAALAMAEKQKSVEAASSALVKRLGKPTWTEDGKRQVWVAATGDGCYRLVLEPDGSLEIDGAKKDQKMTLAPGTTQDMCTGEITSASRQ